jgi:hypothetical protein
VPEQSRGSPPGAWPACTTPQVQRYIQGEIEGLRKEEIEGEIEG